MERLRNEENASTAERFVDKTRLNLNDLLERRHHEKKTEKKPNILIFSSAGAIIAVVLLILSI